jgi:hypothetical protein
VAKSGVFSRRRAQCQRKGRRFQDVSAGDHGTRVFRSAGLRLFVAETRGFLIIMTKSAAGLPQPRRQPCATKRSKRFLIYSTPYFSYTSRR